VSLVVALDGEVGQDLQVAVYRSVAEGITNALRHADADTIRVEVRSASDRLVVEVVDDGSGGPVVHGVGLSSLGQRARGLGGRLEVCPAAGRGTRLRLELPLHPPTDHEDVP
jgi:signal transduction histidine kinase